MPLETLAVLGAAIVMFLVFGGTLAWVSRHAGSLPASVGPDGRSPAE